MMDSSRSINVVGMSVVNLSGVEVGVGYLVEELSVLNGTVEWEAKWVVVDVVLTGSNLRIVIFRMSTCLLSFVWDIWAYNHVELVSESSISTLGQKESFWETTKIRFGTNSEFAITGQGCNHFLVQFFVASIVVLVEVVLMRVTFDYVFTRFKSVFELVKLDKVDAVFADVDVTTIFVVFRPNKYSDNRLMILVGFYMDLVSKWLVVETILASPNLEFVVLIFFRSYEYSIAQVGIEVVEIGDKTVEFHVSYFNSIKVQIFFSVSGKRVLVFLEVQDDLLV